MLWVSFLYVVPIDLHVLFAENQSSPLVFEFESIPFLGVTNLHVLYARNCNFAVLP